MKNFYHYILSIIVILSCIDGIKGQVSSGDFLYSSSISNGLEAPTRMAIDNNDNIFVTDANAKNIKKFDQAGNLLATISINGTPLSIAVNSNNQLFVGDAITGNILKINANGSSSIFYSGTSFPNSMSFSPDNHLYIADSKLKKVVVLDADGTWVQNIGDGTLIFPTGISYDRKNNRLLVGEHGAVNDVMAPRVYIYALDGTMISLLGIYGNGNGKFYRIQGVTAGRCGNIYVVEPFQGNISVYKENGVFLTKFSQFGMNPGQLNIPMDIAFDSQERIWISSMNNGRLEVFTINDLLPSASIISGDAVICNGQSADISIKLTGVAPWSLTYTIDGQNPTVVNNITTNPYLLSATQAGTYVVTAVNDASTSGTCFSGSATLTMNSQITASITGGTTAICNGMTTEIPVQFSGDGPWEISYTLDGTNPVTISNITSNPYLLEVSQAGTYEIATVIGPQCSGVVLPGNAVITVNPIPTASMTNTVNTICEGHQANIPVQFTGTAPWNFDYTVDGMNPVNVVTNNNPHILSVSDAGTYQITALADANCNSTNFSGSVDVIVNTTPVSSFTYLVNNLTVNLFNSSTNATSYLWNFGDNVESNQANPIHTYTHAGTFNIRLSSWNEDCRAYNVIKSVTVTSNSIDTAAVNNPNYDKSLMINSVELITDVYPNPSNGLFTLEINNIDRSDLRLEVTNIAGQVIFKKMLNIPANALLENSYREQIDLNNFSEGVYTLKVISGEAVKTNRLILTK